ncbi:glycosyltransferase family 2 protein [Pedobacter sp. GR22-6]|uniref:glycosyltransferase family 2 protein n=1 Tax=Pedobacter sp. GR22-6 TaxID=3127957 RepID=UPI00307DC48B
MFEANTIDVVIPSFRLEERILLNIFNVDIPAGFKINFYVVADNPELNIPLSIGDLAQKGVINLIVNVRNLGFSRTRNKGIGLGNGKWVLLLDDDIVPEKSFLTAYADAIFSQPNAVGFAGVTRFPRPFNSATQAMELHGMTGHFKAAEKYRELMWVPTANVMLNREKMDKSLFNEDLLKGGEDIEFLVRTAKRSGEKYVGVPDASVEHPWWNNGRIQTERTFRYGAGAAQIAKLPAINAHTYHDFTNTSETLLLLALSAPFILSTYSWGVLSSLFVIVLGAEILTNVIKSVYLSGRLSLSLAAYLIWLKVCYEFGYLWENIRAARLNGFTERIDMSFGKEHPSWFRLNKWKIIKMILILIGLSLLRFV